MLAKDWMGNLYCGIQLDWDYAGQAVNISMPGYIKKKLQEYRHIIQRKIRNALTHRSQNILGQKPKHLSPG